MPRMNGAELVDRARAARPGLRAIVVSGYADLAEGAAFDVPRLAKPFTDAELAGAIAAAAA
jgi:CheY-like chemotaxis protein